jgi:hypothetical protein
VRIVDLSNCWKYDTYKEKIIHKRRYSFLVVDGLFQGGKRGVESSGY